VSVVELRFYAWNAPNGTLLGTLTDEDIEGFEIRPEHRGAESGLFSISRSHPEATTALLGFGHNSLAGPRLVKVHFPWMPAPYDTEPAFAFFLWEGDFKLLDQDGDDLLTFSGPGVRGIWSEYVLYHSSTVSDQPARGSADHPGKWWWINQPYGAIATRIFEEGRHNPYPGAAASNSTFQHVSIDFDRVTDSDGATWSVVAEEYEFPIRTDAGTVLADLEEAGDFTLVGRPNLSFSAYEAYGDDLTGSAYGSGVVRAQGDAGTNLDNILTSLSRHSNLNRQRTHLLGEDMDGNYFTKVHPSYSSGPERWQGFHYPETNDDTLLNKKAAHAFVEQQRDQNQIEVEVKPGNSPSSGRYLPFVHYKPGDTITVDTGAGEHDYTNEAALLTAFRVSLAEAADDADGDSAARSLHVVWELNTQRSANGLPAASVNNGSGIAPPIGLCRPGTAGTPAPIIAQWHFATNGFDDDGNGWKFTGGGIGGGWKVGGYFGNGAAASGAIQTVATAECPTVATSTLYNFSALVRNRSAGGSVKFEVQWLDAGGGFISTAVIATTPVLSAWTAISGSATSPSSAARVKLKFIRDTGVSNSLDIDDVIVSGGGGTSATPGDGHPDLVDGGSRASRCGHSHHLLREGAPTPNDDASHGIPVTTQWTDIDTGRTWVSIDNTTGAAIWLLTSNGSLGGITDHDDLGNVTSDQHHAQNHQSRHNSGGADALKLDDLATPDDNTDLNASTSRHGLLRKLSGTATEYLDGSGAWSSPAGGGGGMTNPMTTAGDIIKGGASGAPQRLGIGTDGHALVSDGSAPVYEAQYATVHALIDGGGSVITTGGPKGPGIKIDFSCEIVAWDLEGDVSSTSTVDIKKRATGGGAATSITASAKPALTAAIEATSATLTGWTTTIAAGDKLYYHVDANNNAKQLTVALKVRKT
jgi:hypothetical protein